MLGKDIVERGLTEDQIQLFLLACEATTVGQINNQMLAFASVMGGKDAQKSISKTMAAKKNILMAELVRMTIEDGS